MISSVALHPTRLFLSLCFLIGFLPVESESRSLESKAQQKTAIDVVLSELETHYGMSEFKAEAFGVQIEKLRKKYHGLVDKAQTLEEFHGYDEATNRKTLSPFEAQQLLIGLSSEFKDGHLNVFRFIDRQDFSTGIEVELVDGRVTYVGSNEYISPSPGGRSPTVGDIITHVNDIPVEDLLRRQRLYTQSATTEASRARASSRIFNTSTLYQRPVEVGSSMKVELVDSRGEPYSTFVTWKSSKKIKELKRAIPFLDDVKDESEFEDQYTKDTQEEHLFGDRATVRTFFKDGLESVLIDEGVLDGLLNVGASLNAELNDDTPIQPVTRIDAYEVPFNGKIYGVLRVPDYSSYGWESVANEARWIEAVLKKMEIRTDGLIIDHLHNSGGSVAFATALIKMLADEDEIYQGMKGKVKLSQTLISETDSWFERYHEDFFDGAQSLGHFLNHQNGIERARKLYQSGEDWMESSFFADASAADVPYGINAGKGIYTKKVLVLNDLFSASCGDMVPALLQQNNRAYVFGEKSAGLGGLVYRNQSNMPGSELYMRCTFTYCELPDGSVVENTGTKPDLHRVVTHEDLRDGFNQYARDVFNSFDAIIEGKDLTKLQRKLDRNMRRAAKERKAVETFLKEHKGLVEKDPILPFMMTKVALVERLQEMRGLKKHSGKAKQEQLREALSKAESL